MAELSQLALLEEVALTMARSAGHAGRDVSPTVARVLVQIIDRLTAEQAGGGRE